jgi:putative redox protein
MSRSTTCVFTNARDERLSARLEHPGGPVRATAVFAHCFTCSKDLRAARRLARALAERGIAVLSFDFAGLGSSEGDFAATTFSSDVDDLVAAAGYLADTIQAPSLLVGHSLGGAAVLTAADRLEGIQAVATIGAPSDVSHITNIFADDLDTIREQGQALVSLAGRPFTIAASFVEDLRDHHLTDTVSRLDAALLFLHAPLDGTVGVDNARLLFEAARHPKSFVSLADADHLLTDEADARYAAEVVAAWADRYLWSAPDASRADRLPPLPRGSGSYDEGTTVAGTGDGLTTELSTRGFALIADEPRSVGGAETGPTPYDYLAAGLAACTSMTLRMYADREGIPLDDVTTSVSLDRVHADDCATCEHTNGRIERFTRTVTLRGDLDRPTRDRLLSIADRCPVHRTLRGQIEIHTAAGD